MNNSYPAPMANRRGLTLIELLIVVSIMVLLAAISVPMLKPMLESQRSKNGARALAMVLQRARYKAMQEQRTYGIEFVRYMPDESVSGSGDATNLAIQMRLVREGNSITSLPGLTNTVGIRINAGKVELWRFNANYLDTNSDPWTKIQAADSDYTATWNSWNAIASPGAYIRLGRQGRAYQLDESDNTKLMKPYNNLTLPQPSPSTTGLAVATDYLIVSPRSIPALTAPVALPRGTVVDLQFSSYRNPPSAHGAPYLSFNGFDSSGHIDQKNKVRIMFSPSGAVHACEYGTGMDQLVPYGGQFYFLVGEWDRQATNPAGETLTDDGLNNLMIPSNYWVTINAETGEVRAAEMNPVAQADIAAWKNETNSGDKVTKLEDMLKDARKFASEVFTNIGGF